jgi:hypothetical protein
MPIPYEMTMKSLYFRDDQAKVREWTLAPPTSAGITFGKLTEAEDEPTWRVVWRGAPATWSLEFMYPGWDKMARYPEMQRALQALPVAATIDEFCRTLESLGFANARTVAQAETMTRAM